MNSFKIFTCPVCSKLTRYMPGTLKITECCGSLSESSPNSSPAAPKSDMHLHERCYGEDPVAIKKTVRGKRFKVSHKKLSENEWLHGRGLYHYGKWWKRRKVGVFVNGNMLEGIPAFTDCNTLRIISDKHSYFVPLEKIDYIRTDDAF